MTPIPQRRPISVRQLILACFVGLVIGVGGFWLTSMEPDQHTLGLCYPTVSAAFDPWTGLPHGATITCPVTPLAGSNSGLTYQVATPPDLAGRQALPVPLGFVVGAGLVILGSTVSDARRRRSG